jgi:hypothetical protein
MATITINYVQTPPAAKQTPSTNSSSPTSVGTTVVVGGTFTTGMGQLKVVMGIACVGTATATAGPTQTDTPWELTVNNVPVTPTGQVSTLAASLFELDGTTELATSPTYYLKVS